MKRALVLVLLVGLLIPTFFSCGNADPPPDTTGAATDAQPAAARSDVAGTEELSETEPTATKPSESDAAPTESRTTAPSRTTDPEKNPAGSDEETVAIRIALDTSATEGTGNRNPRLFAGPDEIDDQTPAVERAVSERNRAARETLRLSVEYVCWDDASGEQAEKIKTLVQSGAAEAPDLFVSPLRDLTRAAFDGCFADIISTPGCCLNVTGEGWLTGLIGSLSFSPDRAYLLAGDGFPDLFRGVSVLPFNLTMADAEARRLSPCILPAGTSLESGETFSDRLFDLVGAGDWTYGTLASLSAAIWRDFGTTDREDDLGDLLGFVCDAGSHLASAAFLSGFGSDCLSESTDPETGRVSLTYRADGGSLAGAFDALSELFAGAGTVLTFGGYGDSSEPGLADLRRKFAEGTVLFAGAVTLGSLAYNEYRNMTEQFSVLPLPKLKASDAYLSPVSFDADAGAINRRSAVFSAVSSYLQYCAEHSREIADGYLADLARAAAHDGTARMLRIIRGSVLSARGEMIERAVSDADATPWHLLLDSAGFRMTGADFADKYSAAVPVKQERLNGLLNRWYSLPDVAAAE